MPIADNLPEVGGMLTYVWRLTETADELRALCAQQSLPTATGMRSADRQREVLATRLLIATALGSEVSLGHDQNGAPVLAGSDKHVSISHTRGLVMLAVSDNANVGVDVEYRSERVLRVRHKFLDDAELAAVCAASVEQNMVLWTLKEALYKAALTPMLSLRDDLHVHVDAAAIAQPDGIAAVASDQIHVTGIETRFCGATLLTGEYVISWVWRT